MIIDTMLKGIRTRYAELEKQLEDECAEHRAEKGEDCIFNTKMEWIDYIIERYKEEEEDSYLDLAACYLLKQALEIENQ